jgi:hypothetical protein
MFVARGFSQKEGEYYDETFSPVARYTYTRAIMSIAASMGWSLHQMDVKTTFLNGEIEEEVYIEKPQGFEVHSRDTHVCRLKSLYGLNKSLYDRVSLRVKIQISYKIVNNAPMILECRLNDT